jgi:N-acetylneuraminic acid mutarotase
VIRATFELRVLLASLLASGCGQAAPEYDAGWNAGPSLPMRVQELHGATLGDRIYVAGGIAEGNSVTSRVFVLDPGAEEWRRVADMPEARHHMPLVAAGDSLYAIGGYNARGMIPVATVWVYDEAADRWLDRVPLPEPRGASAAGFVNGRIVVVGGVGPGNRLLDSIAIYNPGSGSWTRGAPLPTPRDHLAAAVVDDVLYAAGGRPLDPDRNFAQLDRYDPSTAGWTTLAPMPTARGGLEAAALGSAIHVFGGETSSRVFAEHEVFDTRSGQWRTWPPLPTARHGLAAASRGGEIYVIAGGPRAGLAQTAVVEVYTGGSTR